MKTLIALVAVAFATPSAYAQSSVQQAEAYYRQGITAEKSGDPDTALQSYKAALKLNPRHANARYRAGQVKINANSLRAGAVETKIGAVVLPVFQLEDATLQEAIEALGIGMDAATDGKTVTNFIITDPANKLAGKTINLNLKNIPVSAVLNYITTQTNSKARFGEHAVVITPR